MRKPKMILFDFGETLITEKNNPTKGNQALLKIATKNPDNTTADEIRKFAMQISQEINNDNDENTTEVHAFHFNKYLFEYFGIEFNISPREMEQIFLSASIESKATPDVEKFLSFLDKSKIRTGVISNMAFSGKALEKWIQKDLPFNKFEFIIASSEYIFRKPNKYIFEIALKKAKLSADEVWYCGNNFICDVLGPYNVGMRPVWYKGANWFDNANGVVCSFMEIADWNELKEIISNAD